MYLETVERFTFQINDAFITPTNYRKPFPQFSNMHFFLFLWYKVSLTFWLYFFSFASQVKNSWNVYSNLIVLKSPIDILFINWRSMKRMGLIGLKLILKITKSAWISLRRYFNCCLFLCPSCAPIEFSLVCETRMFALHLKWSLFNYFGCFRNL